MNRIELIGRLTTDIDLKFTSGGMAYAKMPIAVDRRYSKEKKEQERKENKPTADFPRVILMGKNAENAAKYLAKGAMVAVEGRINTNHYENADGQKIFTTEVFCEHLHFLESGKRVPEVSATDELDSELFEIEEITN